ncbi:hypothetical protein CVT25_014068 [Psilocybe cyanescens]|uniref:6,7-dimethyl-8-ribityllumazine synthase n=1 Tax=Psilocybe cyanescens TaxID=93625 RepID=A0A409VPE3_PSICY|nr:hypothetical protein CVT25_014068 [Psilocybe cyanescens]
MSTDNTIKGLVKSDIEYDGSALRVAIVHARWNKSIIDSLVAGAVAKLKERGVKESNIVIESVPGSFELPLACSRMIAGSHIQTGSNVTDLLGGLNFGGGPSRTGTPAPAGVVTMPNQPFDAVIAIGVLIKGATMHFEYICDSVSQALMKIQLDTGVPVIFGVLTALTDDQALERAGLGRGPSGKGHNHGEDWGLAAVEMGSHVLLMGASGSGKTSMRSLIFSNNPASLTERLGATIDVEQNHVRFLGDLILNLWDLGGQDSFMDSYLTTQRTTIFQQVGVMIYVFDVETREMGKDLEYFRDCMAGLKQYSPDAAVFLLVHKMDLVREPRQLTFQKKKQELEEASGDTKVNVFGTSIYDESLYKAWSNIVHTLIPNATILSKHLTTFAGACNATEVILFERTTFLVIATSSSSSPSSLTSGSEEHPGPEPLNSKRYERTSELIKAFKHSCSRVREEFRSLEMELYDFTAVLDEMTRNTYVLIIVHDPTIEAAALKLNIRLARSKFEELQSDSLVS